MCCAARGESAKKRAKKSCRWSEKRSVSCSKRNSQLENVESKYQGRMDSEASPILGVVPSSSFNLTKSSPIAAFVCGCSVVLFEMLTPFVSSVSSDLAVDEVSLEDLEIPERLDPPVKLIVPGFLKIASIRCSETLSGASSSSPEKLPLCMFFASNVPERGRGCC